MFRRLPIAAFACAGALLLFAHDSEARSRVNPVFAPILRQLRASTTVHPVLLPSRLPPDAPTHLVASVANGTTPDSYDVVLSTEKGCILELCEWASIYASPARYPEIAAERIRLRDGTIAFYRPFTFDCRSGCHEAQIWFTRGDTRYVVGIKAERRRREVEILANSMVEP
jgi:hypothetical protein